MYFFASISEVGAEPPEDGAGSREVRPPHVTAGAGGRGQQLDSYVFPPCCWPRGSSVHQGMCGRRRRASEECVF